MSPSSVFCNIILTTLSHSSKNARISWSSLQAVKSKNNVLVVPARAIIIDKTGAKTIRLINNKKTKEFEEVSIVTGMEGDGGMVEVTSGLSEGDEFVTLIKN